MNELLSALTALETLAGLSEFLLRTRNHIPADTVDLLRQTMIRVDAALERVARPNPGLPTIPSDGQIDMWAGEFPDLRPRYADDHVHLAR